MIGVEGRDRNQTIVNRLKNGLTSKHRHGSIPCWAMSMNGSDAGVLQQKRRSLRLAQLGGVLLLRLLKRWSRGTSKGLFEIGLGGTEGVGHKKRGLTKVPLERLDDASLRLRYISKQSYVTRAMAFSTQDLLVLFGSFGMALFALNLYKLTKPANS